MAQYLNNTTLQINLLLFFKEMKVAKMHIFRNTSYWLLCLFIIGNFVYAQEPKNIIVNQLKKELQKTTVDTTKINFLNEIASNYKYNNAQEGLKYGEKALLLSQKINWKKGIAQANETLGICHQNLSNYSQALDYFQKALPLYEQMHEQSSVAATLKNIAFVYTAQKKYSIALSYFEKALKINEQSNNKVSLIYTLNDIADAHFKQNNYSEALRYYTKSIEINGQIKDKNGLAYCYTRIGEIYSKQKKYSEAVKYLTNALAKYDKNQTGNIDNALTLLSKTYLLMSESDSKNKTKYIILSQNTLKQISANQKEYSQSVDFLKESLNKVTSDTAKINVLNRITSSYFYTSPKEGIPYGEAALRLSNKINWKKGIAVSNINLGVCQWVLTDYPKAINYFYKALSTYQELKDQAGISESFNNLGLIYVEMNKYEQAFKYFEKAFTINKKTGNKISMVYNLNNIASAYYNQKNYNKALEYYYKSRDLNLSMSDPNGLGYSYTKIGKIFSDQKKLDEGLDYFKKALNSFDKGQSYNIGNTYLEMGILYNKMALENSKEKHKLLNQATLYLNEAIHLFSKAGIMDRLKLSYFELYKSKKEQGRYDEALTYFEKHNILEDSLFSNENQNKINNIQTKQEIDLKDKQIEIQKLKIKSDTRKVYLLAIITFSIALLFILFFWLYVTKRKTNQLLLEKNKEILNVNKQKDKFFSIIAHDLRGPFNGFLGLTELLAEDINEMNNDEIQFASTNMRSSAQNLKRLLDNLLEWSKMEQGLIPFSLKEINLAEITEECTAPFQNSAHKKEISIDTKIDQNVKIFADQNILQSVIRNILSNAIKFTPRKGSIKIQGWEDMKNTFISIADSGIGMNPVMLENIFKIDVKNNRTGTEDEPSSGLGLVLCKEFVKKHNGEIWIESEEGKGSVFYCSFPKIRIK